jgi:hypothetical protein
MSDFEFFYADIKATISLLNQYIIGEWYQANNGVVASGLRGGLLDSCNIRFSFLPIPQDDLYYRQEDIDYKNQKLIIFPVDHWFRVLDKYQLGDKTQVLMSPVNEIQRFGLQSIINAAREDFGELHDSQPVDALNTPQWRRKVATVPGFNSKTSLKKDFRTEWYR